MWSCTHVRDVRGVVMYTCEGCEGCGHVHM